MEEEWIGVEKFFGGVDKQEQVPLVRVSDHKLSGKGRVDFDDVKVKLVMRIEGCGREKAVQLIEERSAELRAKENAKKDVNPLGDACQRLSSRRRRYAKCEKE